MLRGRRPRNVTKQRCTVVLVIDNRPDKKQKWRINIDLNILSVEILPFLLFLWPVNYKFAQHVGINVLA